VKSGPSALAGLLGCVCDVRDHISVTPRLAPRFADPSPFRTRNDRAEQRASMWRIRSKSDNEVSEERKEGRKRQGAARFQPWAGRPCYSTMAGCRAVKAYDVAGRWSTSASPNPEIPLIRPALNVKR
jgi:hypothetical protein